MGSSFNNFNVLIDNNVTGEQVMQTLQIVPHCHRVHRILKAESVEGEARHILWKVGSSTMTQEATHCPTKMETESNKMGTWNLGFGSNMNVKNVTEKKLVEVLGKQ